MIGCVSVFKRTIEHAGRSILIGGFGGTCTRADLRGRGIGTLVCLAAMQGLHDEGCAFAMLAVGADSTTNRFYEPFGFRKLGRPFVFVNIHGQRKTPQHEAAMVAPICSPDVFALVMASPEPLGVGPEAGYW